MKKLFSSARGRFIACVAVSNLLAGLLSLFVWAPLSAHILPPEHPLAPWVPMLLAILLALPVSGFVSRLSARPLQQMLHATQAVARGDYTVRVDETAGGELGELLRSFNRMTAELGSTEMMRSDFISTFSHEFKTPIVSIRGFARRLRRGGLRPEQQNEYLDFIAAESLRLSRLASGILLLSKYEAQNLVADQAPCDLDEQLRASVLRQESRWAPRGLTFEMDLPRLRCRANAEMLGHVWDNLIGNAVKFSHDGGCIHICGRTEGEKENAFVTVTIRDEGVGIPQQALGHIFDKFYQADPARAAEGSGLGLPLVRRILDLCGGRITVQSAPGRGSTFTVTLPQGGANGSIIRGLNHTGGS